MSEKEITAMLQKDRYSSVFAAFGDISLKG